MLIDSWLIDNSCFRNNLAIRLDGGSIRASRFTDRQLALFAADPQFAVKSRSNSGVKIEFASDTRRLALSYELGPYSRPDPAVDLLADDEFVSAERIPTAGPQALPAGGRGRLAFDIPGRAGTRKLSLYLPYAAEIGLSDIQVDDGARLDPAAPAAGRLLFLGDSITQGACASGPSSTFAANVAGGLQADFLNQGLGGHFFDPASLDSDLPWRPERIIIAYGTNDWNRETPLEEFGRACRDYFGAVSLAWPEAAVSVITPLWRENETTMKGGAGLEEFRVIIAREAGGRPGWSVVPGPRLVPAYPVFFADGLHPNDEGFATMSERLLGALFGDSAEGD